MRRLAISLVLLAAAGGGCKRSSSETAPPDPPDAGGPNAGESESESETAAARKPEGCADAQDCLGQGTLGFLAGDTSALAMLDYACAEGLPDGCQNLSTALRSGLVPEDPAAAHVAAARGCELGNLPSCVDLGSDEAMGLGGATQDFEAAHDHFRVACEGGEPKGCRYLGVLEHEGSLGSPDEAAAFGWFDKACAQGDSESCYNAGVLVATGALGEADLPAASQFMTRGCELGDPEACSAREQIDAELAAQTSKVPGANLSIGTATVNGLTVNELECRVEGGGLGLFGNMALIGALADRKASIDKCGKKGTLVEVTWTASGGKITKAEGVGSEGKCVAKVLQKIKPPVDGECAATIVLGS